MPIAVALYGTDGREGDYRAECKLPSNAGGRRVEGRGKSEVGAGESLSRVLALEYSKVANRAGMTGDEALVGKYFDAVVRSFS